MKSTIPENGLIKIGKKWDLAELSVFGSVLREDFGLDSDVDILFKSKPGIHLTFNQWFALKEELETLFGREVDLIEATELTNPVRRESILSVMHTVYAA